MESLESNLNYDSPIDISIIFIIVMNIIKNVASLSFFLRNQKLVIFIRISKMGCDDVYIISACRTGIGAPNGQFKNTPANVLGAAVIKNCIDRARILPADVSDVIMGHVLTAGQGQNTARQAAVAADITMTTPACTISMLGGSSLKAILLGYQSIRCNGKVKYVVCGGQENMTMAQHSTYIRNTEKFHGIEVQDTMLVDGLIDPFSGLQMGHIAEYFSISHKIEREIQDRFALYSHTRAAKAVLNHDFVHEIIPICRSESTLDIVKDELVEINTTLTQLNQLPVVFEEQLLSNCTVTEGNSAPNGDGAAAVILCNQIQIELLDLVPLAKIIAFFEAGVESVELGTAIVKVIEQLLALSGWEKKDVDLYEIDEMFACQPLYVVKQLGLNFNRVNIAGGSIALGQPLGAHGARLVVTLLHNLHRLGLSKGIAVASSGCGMAIGIAIERT
ncbi:hypothetical protein FQA39_LY04690 [Lamprigera yunnana]|nr:hypothetical protein FQA39_LY04690 [Lamprigera yunnana]